MNKLLTSTSNLTLIRLIVAAVIGLVFFAVAWQMQADSVSTNQKPVEVAQPRGTNLVKLQDKVRTETLKSFPGLVAKDATDKSDAWSIAGIAPGYNFSTSVDLGKYHLSLQTPDASGVLPAEAFKQVSGIVVAEGGQEIPSPVPTSYPSKAGSTGYFTYKNAACYVEQNNKRTAVNVDCAYNSDFAKVADAVKPYVALYDTSNNIKKPGHDYAVHMPFTGKSMSGNIDYAALPLNGTVAYYYNDSAKGWKYHDQSGTGLECSKLSGIPKEAFATLCKA